MDCLLWAPDRKWPCYNGTQLYFRRHYFRWQDNMIVIVMLSMVGLALVDDVFIMSSLFCNGLLHSQLTTGWTMLNPLACNKNKQKTFTYPHRTLFEIVNNGSPEDMKPQWHESQFLYDNTSQNTYRYVHRRLKTGRFRYIVIHFILNNHTYTPVATRGAGCKMCFGTST